MFPKPTVLPTALRDRNTRYKRLSSKQHSIQNWSTLGTRERDNYCLKEIIFALITNIYAYVVKTAGMRFFRMDLGKVLCNLFDVDLGPLQYYINEVSHLCIEHQLLLINLRHVLPERCSENGNLDNHNSVNSTNYDQWLHQRSQKRIRATKASTRL